MRMKELKAQLTISFINHVFDVLERTDYGYEESIQEIEARFWDRFFNYFKKLQKTEQNRIINQLCDIAKE